MLDMSSVLLDYNYNNGREFKYIHNQVSSKSIKAMSSQFVNPLSSSTIHVNIDYFASTFIWEPIHGRHECLMRSNYGSSIMIEKKNQNMVDQMQ